MLQLTNNQNWAGRRPGDACRGAADGEMLPTRIAVRRNHDQIDIEFLGCFDDLMCRHPVRIVDLTRAAMPPRSDLTKVRKLSSASAISASENAGAVGNPANASEIAGSRT